MFLEKQIDWYISRPIVSQLRISFYPITEESDSLAPPKNWMLKKNVIYLFTFSFSKN